MYPDLGLNEVLFGPPRSILKILFWNVGDSLSEQITVSLIISVALFTITIGIYVSSALMCCGKRSQAGQTGDIYRKGPDLGPTANLWTIHNKRYDMRTFVSQHPGGTDAISLGQGHNCTELFESYHTMANEKLVKLTLSRYFVEDAPADAPDYEVRFKWKETPFYDTLKARVREHFRQKYGHPRHHHANCFQWGQIMLFTVFTAMALYGAMRCDVLGLLLLPFCYWWGPSTCMHDGGHFALSPRPWINHLVAHLGGAHMSMFSWYHQHTIGHHVDTNIAGCDPDLYHFTMNSDTGLWGFRTSPELRTLSEAPRGGVKREKFWRNGLWLRVPFTTFGPSVIWDMISLTQPQFVHSFLGIVPYRKYWIESLVLHSIGRSMIIWLAIIHPIAVSLVTAGNWWFGIAQAVVFVVWPYAIHGCIFYSFSQVSHVQKECSKINLDKIDKEMYHHSHPRDLPMSELQGVRLTRQNFEPTVFEQQRQSEEVEVLEEWAIHQVNHALDYAVDSKFWSHISLGLNLQVVHHLFPQIAWCHYQELSPIVRDVCAEFKVPYSTKPTFWDAIASHFNYLKLINDDHASTWIRAPPGRACAAALVVLGQIDLQKAM